MENTTISQRIGIFVAPMISGCLSVLSSATINFMILRSKTKLSSSHRRLVFGLSCYDIFYSFARATSSLPVPPSDFVWGAVGNRQTCNAQAFLMVIGTIGAPLYNLHLCIFQLSTIVFSMKKTTFVKRVEPFLHGFTILYTWSVSIFFLVTGYYNTGDDSLVCWIGPSPRGCTKDPNLVCERGQNWQRYRWIFVGGPLVIILLLIVFTMTVISWKYYKQQRSTLKFSFQQEAKLKQSQSKSSGCHSISLNQKSTTADDSFGKPRTSLSSLLQRSANTSSLKMTKNIPMQSNQTTKSRKVMTQAMLYILAYFMTWSVPLSVHILEAQKKRTIPYALRLTSFILSPAQGVMNLFVFTRPHVIALRNAYPDYSWFKAFIIVVKSGGDNDGSLATRRRKGSLRS